MTKFGNNITISSAFEAHDTHKFKNENFFMRLHQNWKSLFGVRTWNIK